MCVRTRILSGGLERSTATSRQTAVAFNSAAEESEQRLPFHPSRDAIRSQRMDADRFGGAG